MSSQKIQEAALKRFSIQGYDATSLSEIASDAGIRKPSIYAHFTSKKQLFMALLENAFQMEKDCIHELLTVASVESLKNYTFQVLDRYETDYYLLFWLRTIYLPPHGIESEIKFYDSQYAHLLDLAINKILQKKINYSETDLLSTYVLTDAFTGILRGIHAELLYKGKKNAQTKAFAMWKVFELALSQTSLNMEE